MQEKRTLERLVQRAPLSQISASATFERLVTEEQGPGCPLSLESGPKPIVPALGGKRT